MWRQVNEQYDDRIEVHIHDANSLHTNTINKKNITNLQTILKTRERDPTKIRDRPHILALMWTYVQEQKFKLGCPETATTHVAHTFQLSYSLIYSTLGILQLLFSEFHILDNRLWVRCS